MSETVYVAGRTSGGRVTNYHTDRECAHLQRAKTVLEYSRENIRDTRTECSFCAGTVSGSGGGNRAHYKAALNHDS